jgi:CheY-like chemotaxis protein
MERVGEMPDHRPPADPAILPKILIVEDDFLTQAVIAGFLRGICSTDHARDAKSAVEMAKEKHYSAVLMDIHLGPGQNGVDVTREIRGISGYERSPIVAVTGSTLPGEQERLLSSGLTHYVAKPFDREELIRVLADALDGRR